MRWAILILLLAGCSSMPEPLEVRVVVVEGCPGRDATVERIKVIAEDLDVAIALRSVLVTTPGGAVEAHLLGSPTILVNGLDIEHSARKRSDFSIACRVYGGTPVPPKAMIEAALRDAPEDR